jgi:23S rRNA G2445 N2-methylase RlmL
LLYAIGLNGHVTGLDILPELLAHGESFVEEAGLSKQITFQQGDVNHIPSTIIASIGSGAWTVPGILPETWNPS